MTTTHAFSAPPVPRPARSRWSQAARDAAYLLGAFPMLLLAFVLTVVLVVTGVSTVIIWVGLPILAAGLMTARGFATAERRIGAAVAGRPVAADPYLPARPGGGTIARLLRPITDPQSWMDVLWVFTGFVLATITFSIALTWIVGAIGVVAGPLAPIILSATLGPESYGGLATHLDIPFGLAADVGANFLVGLFFLLTAPAVLRGLASVQAAVGDALLNSRADSRAQIADLRESRAAVRQAESDALRRLERDIHDGPQQRLVRLNMDLARAKRQATTNPEQAEAMIAEAMAQTQETLAELRQLSRGIAPPVLVDRGLEAAIVEAAARSIVPVTVYADVPDDLPDHVQTAAYFVVSEALANINKHSRATEAEVFIGVQDEWLFATVNDNGVGGASPAKGHGLAGLSDRLRGVDGTLTVTSPEGGPTSIEAVIPCGS